ncbi:hypothetical protein [Nannocystis pusilla]|uniref:hypothetical protein n=1 Tax=Nannocystis pusilla TaxID=889268 RepID=UPI003B75E835
MPVCLALGYWLQPLYAAALGGYFLLNLAYSFKLKQIAYVDVLSIAAGFILRVLAGALALQIPASPWLLACTGLWPCSSASASGPTSSPAPRIRRSSAPRWPPTTSSPCASSSTRWASPPSASTSPTPSASTCSRSSAPTAWPTRRCSGWWASPASSTSRPPGARPSRRPRRCSRTRCS